MIFMTAVAQSMVITMICSAYVGERISGLKHLMTVSGMRLKAYWLGSFVFDFVKMEVVALTTIALFYGFNLGYDSCQVCFLLYPLAALPYTYVMSFLFQSESACQTYVMFWHFMTILTVSTVGFSLRAVDGIFDETDLLHWALRFVSPSYCLGSSIYLDVSADLITSSRAPFGGYAPSDDWALMNVTGDAISLCLHGVFWTIVLIWIETRVRVQSVGKVGFNGSPDEDVIAEAKRVKTSKDILKVHEL